ncbi:MAG: histidine phosphatase family protein [Halomonas sp.]|nr:histidine phosphatase family protein [Halomonas sp.]TVM06002.1 MAG: histidine phosphatase family protein [Halomonas sp.]
MITQYTLSSEANVTYNPTDKVPVYLLRHGETDLNARGVLQGSIEEPLNAVGRQQAQAAAQTLSGLGIARIVSSPQSRARQTADIVAAVLHSSIEENALLRERDWGIYEGRPIGERDETGAGVELLSHLNSRACQAFESITADLTAPCLVVAHSGLIKALLAQLCGQAPDVVRNGEIIQLMAQRNA